MAAQPDDTESSLSFTLSSSEESSSCGEEGGECINYCLATGNIFFGASCQTSCLVNTPAITVFATPIVVEDDNDDDTDEDEKCFKPTNAPVNASDIDLEYDGGILENNLQSNLQSCSFGGFQGNINDGPDPELESCVNCIDTSTDFEDCSFANSYCSILIACCEQCKNALNLWLINQAYRLNCNLPASCQ